MNPTRQFDISEIKIEVAPETYTLVSVGGEQWLKLLENPELSPRMTAPFMIFRDRFETTLLLDETDFQTMRRALGESRHEGNFRLLTFVNELDFKAVGFLARMSEIFAEAGIPVVALAAFSRDHFLIKQENLAKALKVLGEHTSDLC